MADSFFTNKTYVDQQLRDQNATETACCLLIEGAVRRLAHLEGATKAAICVQRLADICAGMHVMPIDHWRGPAQKPAPEMKPTRWERVWTRIVGNPGAVFSFGIIVGMWIGAR